MANNVGISVTAKTKGVAQSLSNVSKSLRNIKTSTDGNAKSMGNWYNETRKLNQRFVNLNKDANRTANSISNLGGSIKRLTTVASFFATGHMFGNFINSSIQAIEISNMFNVALGEMSDKAMEVVDKLSELYGLDPTNLKSSIGTYALLAKSMGMTSQQAETLATNTTRMAIDLSSLMNIPIEQVMADLKSGLVGQSETVYKYGMDVTEAGIKQEALAQGITKSVRNMSQGEKMALRYSVMIRNVSKDLGNGTSIMGDFSRTINQPANQLKILSERFTTLGRSIGNAFLPVLQVVLPYLNAFVQVLISVANAIAKFFGYTEDMSQGFKSTGVSKVAEDADTATDAVDGTTKALKDMKNATLGIDELNVMPKDTSSDSSGSGAGGGGSILPDFKLPTLGELDDMVKTKSDEIAKKMTETLGMITKALEPTTTALKTLWDEGLSKLGGFVSTGLVDFYNNFLVPMGAWILGEEGLPRLVSILNNSLNTIDFASINENLATFWTLIQPFAEEFGNGLIDFFEDIAGLSVDIINKVLGKDGTLDSFNNVLAKFDSEKARDVGYAFGVISLGILGISGVVTLITGLSTALSTLTPIISGIIAPIEAFSGLFAEGAIFGSGGAIATASLPVIALGVALTGLVVGLGYVLATNGEVRQSFIDVLSSIVDSLQPALVFITETILPDLQAGWQGFIDLITPFGDFLNTVFTSIWTDMLIPAFQFVADTIIPNLTTVFSKLWKDILVPLCKFIGDLLSPFFKTLSDILKTLWKNVVVPLATALGGVFKSAWDGIYDLLVKVIIPIFNGVIDVLTFLWKKVLKPITTFLLDTLAVVFKDVFEGIGETIHGLQLIFQGVIDFIVGIFTGNLDKALNGVKEVFKGAFELIDGIIRGIVNGMIGMFESFVNGIINGVNFIINAINKIQIDVPDWLENISGISSIGFNISTVPTISLPRITKLAKGGSLNAGQYFEAGENGKAELLGSYQNKTTVMPLENSGFVDAMYGAVYDAVKDAQENDGGTVVENVVNLDGEVIYKNQQKVANNRGINFGMGAFAR